MVKGMWTTVLSETLVQVIVGRGFPSAEQFKVNSEGAVMVWLLEVIMLLGGAKKSNNELNAKRLSKRLKTGSKMKAVIAQRKLKEQNIAQQTRIMIYWQSWVKLINKLCKGLE